VLLCLLLPFSLNTMPSNSRKKQNNIYDVIIVGGGMVSASLALALSPLNLKIALVDAFVHSSDNQPSYDDRAIALSYGSSLIFKGMGLWHTLKDKTSLIKQIHVSDRGHFGATRLTAKQEKVPALGYLVESRILGQELYEALKQSNIRQIIPAAITDIDHSETQATITLEKEGEPVSISTDLIIAADGTRSKVRELSGIQTTTRDYYQSAIIANVSTEKPHQGRAFERFTDEGPIALLPMSENRCSLVWTHDTSQDTDKIDQLMALDDGEFLHQLGEAFGYRLGRFTKVGKRSAYPLSLVTANKNTAERTVIIGNASHTLHPVAGQGLNLALRDVAVLSDLVAELMAGKKQISNQDVAELLSRYESQREGDIKTTVQYTDSLVRLFSNDNALLGHARAGGLLAVDRLPPLRKWLTRKSMGINYRQSRLARGLALRVSS